VLRRSAQISVLIVPGQQLPVRSPADIVRHLHASSVQGIVVPSVLKFLLDPAADLEAPIRRDRDVPTVEQAVNVAPEQEAVGNLVRATFGKGRTCAASSAGRVRS